MSSVLLGKRRCISGVVVALIGLYLITGWLLYGSKQQNDRFSGTRLEHDDDGLDFVLGPQTVPEEKGFTMVTPVFKRLTTLPKFISSYASGNIPSLRRIVLIWGNLDQRPSTSLLESLKEYYVPVVIVQPHIDSLNQRFHHNDHIKTNCVLSMDDDMIYAPEDIEFGYRTWKDLGRGRRRMLGYIAREASTDKKYLISKLKSFSMVLTKSAFYHVDWMQAYWANDTIMPSVRNYVDQHLNCEDLLMSFIHAYYTGLPPILMKAARPLDLGRTDGISSNTDHVAARSACIRHFSNVFGDDTLVSSSLVVSRMGSSFQKPNS